MTYRILAEHGYSKSTTSKYFTLLEQYGLLEPETHKPLQPPAQWTFMRKDPKKGWWYSLNYVRIPLFASRKIQQLQFILAIKGLNEKAKPYDTLSIKYLLPTAGLSRHTLENIIHRKIDAAKVEEIIKSPQSTATEPARSTPDPWKTVPFKELDIPEPQKIEFYRLAKELGPSGTRQTINKYLEIGVYDPFAIIGDMKNQIREVQIAKHSVAKAPTIERSLIHLAGELAGRRVPVEERKRILSLPLDEGYAYLKARVENVPI